jgi:TatD DNase family protein
MSGWTDAHAHLQDEFLESEGDFSSVSKVLARAKEQGVDRVVVIGTGAETSRGALAVTEFSGDVELWATVGLHPHDALSGIGPIVDLARRGHPRLVGIGECGLDYYYEYSPKDAQRQVFAEQIALAHECNLALVIHTRDAFSDLFNMLDSEGTPPRTVIHCFTGNIDDAQGCLERGCDISVSGIVTFKNADDLREAVKAVPLNRLHVETDSPFLAPVPHRGKKNEPALVTVVGEYVAQLRGEDVAVVRAATRANSARLFGISA